MKILKIIIDEKSEETRFCISNGYTELKGFKTREEAERFVIRFLSNITLRNINHMKEIKQKSRWKRFFCRHQFFLLKGERGALGVTQCWKCGAYSMMEEYNGGFSKTVSIKDKK